MSILIRNPDAFKQAKDRLKPEHFGTEAAACAIIWQIVLNYYAEHGKLPDRGTIMARLAKTINKTPAALTETQQTEAESLVEMAFDDEDPGRKTFPSRKTTPAGGQDPASPP